MYLDRAEDEDTKMAEGWKDDAEGLLVFVGPCTTSYSFSHNLESIDWFILGCRCSIARSNPPRYSAEFAGRLGVLLGTNLSATAFQSNGTRISIPSSLTDPSQPFTPPAAAVWVNGLWFLSLLISLTCALLATLLQQWARRYLIVAHPRYRPRKHARIRAFYAQGVENLHVSWTVEALPTLLHISLFLFFAGLSVFLFGVNHTIFNVVIAWVGLCVVVYAYLTFLPIIYKNSPYSGPLSALVSFCLTGMRYRLFQLFEKFPRGHTICIPRSREARSARPDNFFSHSMRKTAEEFALNMEPGIDHASLLWTFESLDEDKELEEFFEGVPALCSPDAATNAQQGFIRPQERKLSSALIGLMNRTLSSNLVNDFVKQRRMIICTKVVDATSLLGPWWTLNRVLLGEWRGFLRCIDFGLLAQKWKSNSHEVTKFYARCAVAVIISTVQEREDRWFQLACGQLDATNSLLRSYLAQGGSLQLANVNRIVRQTVETYSGSAERHRSDILDASSKTLESVCKFEIQRTLPKLQHEFCGVWNQLVETAQNDQRPHIVNACTMTLKNIRKLYIALHEGTDASPTAFSTATEDGDPVLDLASSYPKCTIDGHKPLDIPELKLDDPAPDGAAGAPPTPDASTTHALPPTQPQGPLPTISAPAHPFTSAAPASPFSGSHSHYPPTSPVPTSPTRISSPSHLRSVGPFLPRTSVTCGSSRRRASFPYPTNGSRS
jgi:hypothetical protein